MNERLAVHVELQLHLLRINLCLATKHPFCQAATDDVLIAGVGISKLVRPAALFGT